MSIDKLEKYIRKILTDKKTEGAVWYQEELRDEVYELCNKLDFLFIANENERKEVLKAIESYFEVRHDFNDDILVSNDDSHNPEWINDNDFEYYYWNKYREFLIEQGDIPDESLQAVDSDTKSMLSFFGDPSSDKPFSRKGMIIGDVQSGKTTNFNAIICKAADAGYKLIIVLAGGLTMLRNQTQERLDEAFIGYHVLNNEKKDCGVGLSGNHKSPTPGTSKVRDFGKTVAENALYMMPSITKDSRPIIMVLKKNTSILNSFIGWLDNSLNYKMPLDFPLLIVDDESDYASVDTTKEENDPTKTNKLIRRILSKERFRKNTYLAVTATPYANIFINQEPPRIGDSIKDPFISVGIDSEGNQIKEDLGDDLFPSDFIKITNTPDTYLGASILFSEEALSKATYFSQSNENNSIVRKLYYYNDSERKDWSGPGCFPYDHKKDDELEELPGSLKRAIQVFLLTNTIRYLRDINDHCTMLINVSRFTNFHEKIKVKVWKYRTTLENDIFMNARKNNTKEGNILSEMKKIFHEEFPEIKENWNDIKISLYKSIKDIDEVTINSNSDSIEFPNIKNGGRPIHKIIIGGFSLSRGLTIEGLVTSYLIRKAAASDTLMQMGRFFGYRLKYRDITRVFITEDTAENFQRISCHMQELKDDMSNMLKEKATPKQFGVKIRDNLEIRLTASSKARYSEEMDLTLDFDGLRLEGHVVYNDDEINNKNRDHVRDFLNILGKPHDIDQEEYYLPNNVNMWQNIDVDQILELIENFDFPESCRGLSKKSGSPLFSNYCNELKLIKKDQFIKSWDVILPTMVKNSNSDNDLLPEELKSVTSINSKKTGRGDNINKNFKVIRLGGASFNISNQKELLYGLSLKSLDDNGFLDNGRVKLKGENVIKRIRMTRKKPLLQLFSLIIDKEKCSQIYSNLNVKKPFATFSIMNPMPPEFQKYNFPSKKYRVTQNYREQLLFDYQDYEGGVN